MEDRGLLALSIASSLLGLLMLFYLSQNFETGAASEVKIEKITGKDVGSNVRIAGTIKKAIMTKNKNFYGYIEDGTGSMRFFILSSNKTKDCLEDGKKAKMFGEIEKYEEELEIVLDIENLKCLS